MSSDALNNGGSEGGSARNPDRLRPSELALLRRLRRIPFTQEDCIKVATATMDAVESDHPRTVIAGIKAFAELERLNLAEAALVIDKQVSPTVVNVSTNVNAGIQVNTAIQEAIAKEPEYLEWLESKRLAERGDTGPVRIDGEPTIRADQSPSPDQHGTGSGG